MVVAKFRVIYVLTCFLNWGILLFLLCHVLEFPRLLNFHNALQYLQASSHPYFHSFG